MSEITHPELEDATLEMMIASIDYDDNNGASNADEFWDIFERKRNNYRRVKERLETAGKI